MAPEPRSSAPNSIITAAAAILVAAAAVVVLEKLSGIFQPLFFAVFFFYLSQPIFNGLIKRRVPRWVAYIILIMMVIGILSLFGWIVGANVDDLAQKFPKYKARVQDIIQNLLGWVSQNYPIVGHRIETVLNERTLPLDQVGKILTRVLGSFVNFITNSLLVLFFTIFIAQESTTLPQRLENAVGARRSAKLLEIGQRINRGIVKYVYVKGMASLLVAALSTIAMLAYGLDMAVFWGALIFFGNFIPYIGSMVAVIFPLVICVAQYGSLSTFLGLLAFLIFFQILVGNYLEPRYAGTTLNLSPLIVVISLIFWGWLWGVTGLLLSIPIMVSLKFVFENIPSTRKIAILMSHVAPPREPNQK